MAAILLSPLLWGQLFGCVCPGGVPTLPGLFAFQGYYGSTPPLPVDKSRLPFLVSAARSVMIPDGHLKCFMRLRERFIAEFMLR